MKIFKNFKIAAVFTMTIISLTGCKTGLTEPEKLSAEDEMYLIKNARQILVDSKKINLNSAEKKYVMTIQPKMRYHYTDDKTGKASITWEPPGQRTIIAIAEGELAASSRKWKVMTLKKPGAIYVTPDAAKRLSPEAKKRLNIKGTAN
jgi:hypothetical protein